MLSYCLKCRKKTEIKKPNALNTKNGRIILLPKCTVCGSRKWRFIKEQETSGLLNSLGIKTPVIRIPLVGLILF